MIASKNTNYRVEVYPEVLQRDAVTNSAFIAACTRIKEEIRRTISGVATIKIQCDTEHFCSYCGSDWTEDLDSPDNGGCCKADAGDD